MPSDTRTAPELLPSMHSRKSSIVIGDARPFGPRKFTDAVDRVVVVEGEQEVAAGAEWIRLANQFERAAGVRREDSDVFPRRGVEAVQNLPTRPLVQFRHRARGRVGGVRVAEHAGTQDCHVLAQLSVGVQAAAGVVEVHMPASVEPAVFSSAQRVQSGSGGVGGIAR